MFFILSEHDVIRSKVAAGKGIPRIGLRKLDVCLICFLYFSGDVRVISARNAVPLSLANLVSKRIRFTDAFSRQGVFPKVRIPDAERRIGRGEIRIQFDSTLE